MVKNKLSTAAQGKEVVFMAGNEEVKLSPQIVRNYLVSGDADRVTDQEIVMFLSLCKFQHLNPFLREAYLVKYGNSAATLVTGKDAFMKRAQRNEKYKGYKAGIYVLTESGELESRAGALVLKNETIVGGWAHVYVEGYQEPVEMTVSFDEYVGRKSNGEVNSQWANKPATMIRKVALVQALREAFTDDFAGMYAPEEMGLNTDDLTDEPVQTPKSETSFDGEYIQELPNESPIDDTEPLPFYDEDPLL